MFFSDSCKCDIVCYYNKLLFEYIYNKTSVSKLAHLCCFLRNDVYFSVSTIA